ncbi:MAG: hypothetical protein JW941_01545 [Candidatus Coatesbacteria bacterium]|nr:hypothetical protein [Candidatus Coatesbacteria bacterium]
MMARVFKLVAILCALMLTASCSITITCGDSDHDDDEQVCKGRPCKKEQPCDEKSGPQAGKKPGQKGLYDPKTGAFLDFDLKELEKRAREAYEAGEYEKAARLYLNLLRRNITDGGNIYNLACCYGLLGKPKLAANFLERAYKAGFNDVEWIKFDPDFEKVRDSEEFQSTIACLEGQAKRKSEGAGKPIYISAEAEFRCRVMLPDGFDPNKTYPLLVGLHGYGSDPENFAGLWKRFDNPQFIYAVPQAPYPYLRGNEQGYSWSAPLPDDDPAGERSKLESEEYVAKLVKHLKKEYKVGDTYLLGFSQGCGMTYTTGIKYHELFKGLICFGGWFSKDWLVDKAGIDLKEMNDLRVFIAHGSKDTLVKIEEGEKAKDILKEYGYNVTFYVFDGAHAVPEQALREAQSWMGLN